MDPAAALSVNPLVQCGPAIWTVQTEPRRTVDLRGHARNWLGQLNADAGLIHLHAMHTSCGLLITENADPDVHRDIETMLKRWAPDGDPAYRHDCEGPDDMAAHLRSLLTGSGLTIPVSQGQLLLGTWQGVYLYEHRAHSHRRQIAASFQGSLRR